MKTFNAVSWVLCTFGVTLPIPIIAITHPEPGDTLFETSLGFVLVAGYLSIPYWIYNKQVNQGENPGCGGVLVFLVFTGVLGGIILALTWDLLRFIQSLIMRPPEQTKYAVNTPGLLRR